MNRSCNKHVSGHECSNSILVGNTERTNARERSITNGYADVG
jgi:hypothetical protein